MLNKVSKIFKIYFSRKNYELQLQIKNQIKQTKQNSTQTYIIIIPARCRARP